VIVCTVTPTVEDGTVVRWYRSEIAADLGQFMISASRNRVEVGKHLINGMVPVNVLTQAELAFTVLNRGGSANELVDWATHRRERTFGGPLVPVSREADR
jgi:hypothetical protein